MIPEASFVEGYRAVLHAVGFQASVIDQLAIELAGEGQLPPAWLRTRVQGTPDIPGFVRVGRQCARDLAKAVTYAGRNIGDFRQILDFGCGCGRTMMYLRSDTPLAAMHGTDIDGEAVAWCARHLPFGVFSVNAAEPPLPYNANRFDLIYALSVFTHLDEDYQFRWLEELERIAQPGAVVLATLHGYERWKTFPPDVQAKIKKDGMAFVPMPFWKGIFSDWYQNAYHSEEYVREKFSQYFEVRAYLPLGLDGYQDIVVLEKRSAGPA